MWKRLISIFCTMCLAFTLLYLRIGSIGADPFYVAAGKSQSSYTLELTVSRGFLYDTNRLPLVNQSQKLMAAILVTQENAELVAQITDLNKQEVQEKLQEAKPFLYEVNTQEVDDDNIIVFPVYKRYEQEQTAVHLVGYLSEGKGVSGLEKSYQDLLEQSKRTVEITYTLDAMGRTIPGTKPKVSYSQESDSGIVLTLDSRIQKICEEAGQSLKKGAVVVMDCKTGELRAVCSFPTYSPYRLSEAMQDPDSPMINRAFTPLSVGSTFKIAVAATALEEGINPSFSYECKGGYQLGDVVMHCHNRAGHGKFSMQEAIVNSCNPYFINLGMHLDREHLLRVSKDLSFGKGYELAPGLSTQAGILPKTLSDGELANLSFGQGNLLGTPVQLAQMLSAVANGGITPSPSLVEGIVTEKGEWVEQKELPSGIRSMQLQTAKQLQEFLIDCVEQEGQNARSPYTTSGGKTATAQTGVYADGDELVNGWFVGFTPAEDPEYVIAVIAEDAESGNKSASPVFSEIAGKIALLHNPQGGSDGFSVGNLS
ncbi:Penicillin-binding protein 2 [uncultured Ruminococcus sp.]|nr:Penicillin-binding protein 2 [uncultured Clostridium sp.]SCI13428.1 Penicillin-binding protein 2 [uncultured Ruminococcus sp.]